MEPARREEILSAYRAHAGRFAEIAQRNHRPVGRVAVAVADDAQAVSRRELEVLALVADGYTSKEIGRKLHVSEETVKSHVANVLFRLGARNRAQAVAIALRRGVLVGFTDAASD